MSSLTDWEISQTLREAVPIRLGILTAHDIQVRKSDSGLSQHLDDACAHAQARVRSVEAIADEPRLAAARTAYRACGANPKRHLPSAEALVDRLVRGKGMYRVNNVVDINNVLSLTSLWPVGSYDLAQVVPPIVLRTGEQGETYIAMDGNPFSAQGFPVFADARGIFGGISRDSGRAKITETTRSVAMVVIAFTPANDREEAVPLEDVLELGDRLLRQHTGAAMVERHIVD